MGRRTLGDVLNPQGGPGRVEGPSERSRTVHWTIGEFRDGMGWGTLGTFQMGRGTLGEVWDGSRDPRGCP